MSSTNPSFFPPWAADRNTARLLPSLIALLLLTGCLHDTPHSSPIYRGDEPGAAPAGPGTASGPEQGPAAAPALEAGLPVLIEDRHECLYKGEGFLLFFQGEVESLEEGVVRARVTDRFALTYSPAREGESSEDWFCAPKRRFCYSEVGFRDWGGALEAGETYEFEAGSVLPANSGVIAFAESVLVEACKSPPHSRPDTVALKSD